MKKLIDKIRYFSQFTTILILMLLFRLLGLNLSRIVSGKILTFLGPIFKSKKTISNNISHVFSKKDENFKKNIINEMWLTYGKIFAEYNFMKYFRSDKHSDKIKIEGQEVLEKIKLSNEPVIFISGHFDNFELMAMHIEKSGLDLAAVYRPLNNYYLNPIMENIRKKYICKKQIKKGISGTKNLLKFFKSGTSVALMIDQRVSEGIKSKFFDKDALTTTIPAQFVKKFNCKIVPVYIERNKDDNFKLKIFRPLTFSRDETVESITCSLNLILEKLVITNPGQWIWTHNRRK